jgi:hypothetical protein
MNKNYRNYKSNQDMIPEHMKNKYKILKWSMYFGILCLIIVVVFEFFKL